MSDKFVVMAMDLEMNQPSRRIIEVGVCVGDLYTGEVLDRGAWLVNPEEPLNPFITTLTGIKPEQLATAGTLTEAYEATKAMHIKHSCFCNPVTWGGNDAQELREQMSLDDDRFLFGRRCFDVKTWFQGWRISQREKISAGLAKSMTRVGLSFQGTKHIAGDDAYNTFRMAYMMTKKWRP